MAKPVIVKRQTKGTALDYNELDQNFQNLADATISVTGDTGTIVNDLNGTFKIAGGTALTSSISGTTLTLNLDNTAVTPGSYTNADITVDQQGRITAVANGTAGSTGTVNSGAANRLAYYPSAGNTVDDYSQITLLSGGITWNGTGVDADLQITMDGLGGRLIVVGGGIGSSGTITGANLQTQNYIYMASKTADNLILAGGVAGQLAIVSNAGHKLAFWDTTNTRWSYVHDNSAV